MDFMHVNTFSVSLKSEKLYEIPTEQKKIPKLLSTLFTSLQTFIKWHDNLFIAYFISQLTKNSWFKNRLTGVLIVPLISPTQSVQQNCERH